MAKRQSTRISIAAGIAVASFAFTIRAPLRARAVHTEHPQKPGAIGASSTEFEVASVKTTGPKDGNINNLLVFSGGRLEAKGCTVTYLIMVAYGVRALQVAGAPKWANEARYSISANPPEDSRLTKYNPSSPKAPLLPDERLMLQALLKDRFRLAVHEDTKAEPGLALVLSKRSPSLIDAKDTTAFPVVVFGHTDNPDGSLYLQGINATMSVFSARLENLLGTPVVDETALQGAFDFRIEYPPDSETDAPAPGLLNGIQKLGLKLVSKKVPIVHIMIDHVEMPTEN
jgi:uncharacterized protein (TIGR03435 family)